MRVDIARLDTKDRHCEENYIVIRAKQSQEIFDDIATMLRSSQGIVAWINFTSVIPWLDHGIQLKILKY
ncbi:MAG TPA: hypothetical protein LFV92_04605 [Rickettsia endosymbiont of Ceroptres masudai]|nr:hypothetical protein [Rickettsia endosymbiont of Ceroptres masudai]